MNPQQEAYITGIIWGACLGAATLALIFKLDIKVSAAAAIISIILMLFTFPQSISCAELRRDQNEV